MPVKWPIVADTTAFSGMAIGMRGMFHSAVVDIITVMHYNERHE
jgi:hypothetical protein